jgi:magnesium-transporting ATPase (P-type)
MAPKPDTTTKLGPLGREFRGVKMAGAYSRELFWQAFKDSLAKFDPRVQIHNPVMFVVWVGTLVTLALTVNPSLFGPSSASRLYNGVVTVVLALTVWFANFAEALAEGRGKAKAESLRQTRAHLVGNRVRNDGRMDKVPATALRIGDIVRVEKNEVVPADGEVVEGIAYVNESAITGESADTFARALLHPVAEPRLYDPEAGDPNSQICSVTGPKRPSPARADGAVLARRPARVRGAS